MLHCLKNEYNFTCNFIYIQCTIKLELDPLRSLSDITKQESVKDLISIKLIQCTCVVFYMHGHTCISTKALQDILNQLAACHFTCIWLSVSMGCSSLYEIEKGGCNMVCALCICWGREGPQLDISRD